MLISSKKGRDFLRIRTCLLFCKGSSGVGVFSGLNEKELNVLAEQALKTCIV